MVAYIDLSEQEKHSKRDTFGKSEFGQIRWILWIFIIIWHA